MKIDYLTIGCNNETGIFDQLDGHILYAGGKNVLVSKIPSNYDGSGSNNYLHPVTCALPQAPTGRVHSCQWVKLAEDSLNVLVASEDSFVRLYHCNPITSDPLNYTSWSLKSAINLGSSVTLAAWIHCDASKTSAYFVAATVKGEIYFINPDASFYLIRSFAPKKITALTIGILPNSSEPFVLAALSDSNIRLLIKSSNDDWKEELSISGHQNWITSLSVAQEESHVFALSSSLDKTIRVWKIVEEAATTNENLNKNTLLTELVPQRNSFISLENKKYNFVADSLALGHENAVYFARFCNGGSSEILSGSSDRSLILWNRGFGGAWRTVLQLGDLNGSLGTIGTDHTFAFYGGTIYLNEWIVAAASTGSILFWKKCKVQDVTESVVEEWIPQIPITGHTDRVESIAWSPSTLPVFLASTSKDQSTRIFAPSANNSGYREVARPQIHGYDLKCIALSAHINQNDVNVIELISGADEKVLRVFQAPKQFYRKLGINFDESVPESAELPALGLSNKTIESSQSSQPSQTNTSHLPENEGDLVRNSLWPEMDKLYGHNQEISSLALSPNRHYMATSAKSHLVADAALRIWTRENDESKWICSSVIPAHSLTVSSLVFSPNSKVLLSVSRDRNFCLISAENGTILFKQEAHSRMIFAADWVTNDTFITGSRDKTVKYWRYSCDADSANFNATLIQTISFENGVTSLAVKDSSILAVGDEVGNIFLYKLASSESGWTRHEIAISGGGGIGPADSITDLKWNNCSGGSAVQLAVASADNSIRIISFYL